MASHPGSMLHTSKRRPLQQMDGQWRGPQTPSRLDWLGWVVMFLALIHPASPSPHTPQLLTWQVLSQTGEVVWSVTREAPPYTWWPTLTPDVCALAAGTVGGGWDSADTSLAESMKAWYPGSNVQQTLGCSYGGARDRVKKSPFYVCPRDGRSRNMARKCGGLESFYCAQWGCETTGQAYWSPSSSWDLIQVKRNSTSRSCEHHGWCNPLAITFTDQGKKSQDWIQGRAWGLRFFQQGYDQGIMFAIQLVITAPPGTAMGQNPILPAAAPRPQAAVVTAVPALSKTQTALPSSSSIILAPILNTAGAMINMVQQAFVALNHSNPNATKSCWLCYATPPPYYEAIGIDGNITRNPNPKYCRWSQSGQVRLTLSSVSGQGLCIGHFPANKSHLCSRNYSVNSSDSQYLLPPYNGWWACNSGLTPCVHPAILRKDFCVLVLLVPRLLYHTDSSFLDEIEGKSRFKRELMTSTLAIMLGLGVLTGVSTGTAALVQQPYYFAGLRRAIDTDLKLLEDSVAKLRDSLTSLSEVVLQNRRGLNLLFLKEGGLCAALKEECCFYIDHYGVVTDNLNKLKERLNARRRERESQQSWFESRFNKSPWFTTLISSLVGPLIILLLLLTFGPCILIRLVRFIRERISTVQVLMLHQQYQALKRSESDVLGLELVPIEEEGMRG